MSSDLEDVGTGGWRLPRGELSLREVHGSIAVPQDAGFWRKLLCVCRARGIWSRSATWIPGNWATDLAGGARYGYTLLSVILISNLMAILLQALAVRLGIASGRDLAQACRDHYSRPVTIVLWVLCEIAIAACDLAEVIGAAIALNLLFGLPLLWGVVLDVARRADRAVPAAQGIPLRRSARRRPDSDDRGLLCDRALAGEARPGGRQRGFHSAAGDPRRPATCSTSRSASSARPSCRTTCTCTRRSCRRGSTSTRTRAKRRRSASRRSIPALR